MPRKRRSFGSITEAIKGKKYICRWVENTDEGRKRRSKTVYGTYRDAERFLAKKNIEAGDQTASAKLDDIFEALYLPWLERQVQAGKKKESTARRYREAWPQLIQRKWGGMPMDCIRPMRLQSWLLRLSKGNATIALVVLSKVGDLAVMNGLAKANIFRNKYDMPMATTRKKALNTYSLKQAEEILSSLRGTLSEAPYILSCFGGARVGESLGVRTDEVERSSAMGIEFAIVPIVRRMPKVGSTPLPDGDLKTKQSKRITFIPEPYCFELFRIIELRKAMGSIWIADRGDGLPLNCNSFMYWFNMAMGDKAIPLSNLRSSWRTFAQMDWKVPEPVLEVMMGHKLEGVSGEHYIRMKTEGILHVFAEAYNHAKDI